MTVLLRNDSRLCESISLTVTLPRNPSPRLYVALRAVYDADTRQKKAVGSEHYLEACDDVAHTVANYDWHLRSEVRILLYIRYNKSTGIAFALCNSNYKSDMTGS